MKSVKIPLHIKCKIANDLIETVAEIQATNFDQAKAMAQSAVHGMFQEVTDLEVKSLHDYIETWSTKG